MRFLRDKFCEIRKQKKIKISFLAEMLDKTYQCVRNWEKGIGMPSRSDVLVICKLMDIMPREISDIDNSFMSLLNTTVPRDDIDNKFQAIELDRNLVKLDKFLERNNHASNFEYKSLLSLKRNLDTGRRRIVQLEDALEYYKKLLENTPVIIYVKDVDYKYRYINREFLDILKIYDSKDIIGSKSYEIFGLKEIKDILAYEQHAIERKESFRDIKIKIPGTNGKKSGILNITPRMDRDDNVIDILCIIKDITDYDILSNKYEVLLNSVENSPVYASYIRYLDSPNYQYVSKKFEELTGISCSEIFKDYKVMQRLMHPDDRHIFDDLEKEDFNFRNISLQYRYFNKSKGEYRWCQNNITKYFDKNIKKYYVHGIIWDINDTVNKKRIAKIMKIINDFESTGYSILNSETFERIYTNKAYEKITGYSLEEMDPVWEWWEKLFHPDDYDFAMRAIKAQHKKVKIRIITKKGNVKSVIVRRRFLKVKGESWLISQVNDVTAHQRLVSRIRDFEKNFNSSERVFLFIKNLDSEKLVWSSSNIEKLLDITKDRFLKSSKNLFEIVHPEDKEAYRNMLLSDFYSKHLSVRILNKNKVYVSAEMSFLREYSEVEQAPLQFCIGIIQTEK